MLAIWPLVPLPFLNPAYTSGNSGFSVGAWLGEFGALLCYFKWNECNCEVFWALFGIAFLWVWKTDLFQSCGHCWVFQICWHIECSTFTAPSFRIWNSSTEIPSPPLALFAVMLPKAHLTSHSRMSGSRWVITPSWLSGSCGKSVRLYFWGLQNHCRWWLQPWN